MFDYNTLSDNRYCRTIKRLLLTLPCEHSRLNSTALAACEIELYEYVEHLPYTLKSYHAKAVIDGIGLEWYKDIRHFKLTVDIQRKDGVFEVLHFSNLRPEEIELGGRWIFDLQEPPERIKKLLEL